MLLRLTINEVSFVPTPLIITELLVIVQAGIAEEHEESLRVLNEDGRMIDNYVNAARKILCKV